MNIQTLRVWPAILLLIIMTGVRLGPSLTEIRSMPVFMLAFMGPAVCGMLIWLWWVAFSRASKNERIAGGIGTAILATATVLLIDPTLHGFGAVMYPIPWGFGLFGLAAVLSSQWLSTRRTAVALLAGVIGFGFWTLVRSDGVWGDFRPNRSWRWEPTAEEKFLESIADREPTQVVAMDTTENPFLNPEWSEFRGQRRDSAVMNVVLEEDWEKFPPKEVWKMQVGPAWSSFVLAGDYLITQEQRGEQEAICCYDANTGAVVWEKSFESRFWEAIAGAGPRATPTIQNGRLYAQGAQGLLTCLEPATGELCWQVDLRKDAKREPPPWGFSASPLVYQDVVIAHAGGKDGLGLMAYDTVTGELRWSVDAGDHTYSSPQLAQLDGEDHVLLVDNNGILAVDPTTGNVAWTHEYEFENYRVLQPVQVAEKSFLIGTGFGTGTRRVDVARSGDTWEATEAWDSRGIKPEYNDYVVHDGFIYGFDMGIFACIDAESGAKKWKKGRYGNGQVLLLPSGNQMLLLTEKGEIVLLRTNPEKLEELARFPVIEDKTWNHPILVGEKLFVRNAEWAARFDLTLVASDTDATTEGGSDDADEPVADDAGLDETADAADDAEATESSNTP